MAINLDLNRSFHGTLAVTAVATIATVIWWNWQKGVPVATGPLSALAQPVGNTSAPYSNTYAAPDPANPVGTSWVDSGSPGGNSGNASAQTGYSYYEE
jgi:hypothetical protein